MVNEEKRRKKHVVFSLSITVLMKNVVDAHDISFSAIFPVVIK